MPSSNKVYACTSHIYSIYKVLLRLALGSARSEYVRLSAQLELSIVPVCFTKSNVDGISYIVIYLAYRNGIDACDDNRICEVYYSTSQIAKYDSHQQRNIDYIPI